MDACLVWGACSSPHQGGTTSEQASGHSRSITIGLGQNGITLNHHRLVLSMRDMPMADGLCRTRISNPG
jgi:hypothetical protein